VKIKTDSSVVSGVIERPTKVVGAIALAHGAGAGMNHAFMSDLSAVLTSRGFAVLRYQFPYMEAGRKRVDSPSVAVATVEAAVRTLVARVPGVIVFAAGKSFGARMTTTAAAQGRLDEVDGLICYGFPLHPAGTPGTTRAEHLAEVPMKTLFLQGTRDALADLKLMKKVCAKLPKVKLKIIEGADHGFGVLKRSGRSPDDVFSELADQSAAFLKV
jgi:hypothetical protein